jgi:hypothetical protein
MPTFRCRIWEYRVDVMVSPKAYLEFGVSRSGNDLSFTYSTKDARHGDLVAFRSQIRSTLSKEVG